MAPSAERTSTDRPCAVSGVPIPLAALRYWSVERQEAYASPLEFMAAVREAVTVTERARNQDDEQSEQSTESRAED